MQELHGLRPSGQHCLTSFLMTSVPASRFIQFLKPHRSKSWGRRDPPVEVFDSQCCPWLGFIPASPAKALSHFVSTYNRLFLSLKIIPLHITFRIVPFSSVAFFPRRKTSISPVFSSGIPPHQYKNIEDCLGPSGDSSKVGVSGALPPPPGLALS